MDNIEVIVSAYKATPDFDISVWDNNLNIEVSLLNNNPYVDTTLISNNLNIEVTEYLSNIEVSAYNAASTEIIVYKDNPNVYIDCILLNDDDSSTEYFEVADGLFIIEDDYFLKVKEDGI